MIKVIKRTSDGKFLKSFENDLWVDNVSEAFEMTHRECESVKLLLSDEYLEEDLKVIVNMFKLKPISREEARELKNILKNK